MPLGDGDARGVGQKFPGASFLQLQLDQAVRRQDARCPHKYIEASIPRVFLRTSPWLYHSSEKETLSLFM